MRVAITLLIHRLGRRASHMNELRGLVTQFLGIISEVTEPEVAKVPCPHLRPPCRFLSRSEKHQARAHSIAL
jgi:hypothetical protein